MSVRPVNTIKRAQKESLLYRTIARLFSEQSKDDAALRGLLVTRVELNTDKSICTVFFFTDKGPEGFREQLEQLKLYKPSLRAALAREIASRYAPDLVFRYDAQLIKTIAIEELLDSVKEQE